jgi:hypothetical protein
MIIIKKTSFKFYLNLYLVHLNKVEIYSKESILVFTFLVLYHFLISNFGPCNKK